jgi:hypothetical protein
MADKIDTSVEEEAIKDEARNFMSEAVGAGGEPPERAVTESSVDGAEIVKAWKSTFAVAAAKDDVDDDLMNKFWCKYDTDATSIWTMVYDEADSNENLDDTIEIVTNLMEQCGMSSMKDDCFAIVHTLESLEIEGMWFFNGPDPEKLFGANEETSWFSWSQLGPDATDLVMEAVAKFMVPIDGKLNGKVIKNTTVF